MTQIPDIYANGGFGLSIEIFPPKSAEGDEALRQTLDQLSIFQPAFVSCTYGAGGSTSKRTMAWCREIQERYGLTATAHLTCVGSTRDDLINWLADASRNGVRNIMALRGDPPKGTTEFAPVAGGLRHASELVSLVRENFPSFGIGVAGYPEKHPEAPSLEADFDRLAEKVKQGAHAVFTQLFYNNERFFRFRDAMRARGVQVPIVPGIMPITEFARIQRITSMCGSDFPLSLASRLEQVQHDGPAQFQIGVEYAIDQCRELLDQGVPGLHLYVLNRSDSCAKILAALGLGESAGLRSE